MEEYEDSWNSRCKLLFCCMGSSDRNESDRSTRMEEHEDSWNRRCKLLFCCLGSSDRNENSFAEIAKLLSEIFRDLDVVPSDVIAGLILLRRFQRKQREVIVSQGENDTFQFLSGVAVTSNTRFLDINQCTVTEEIKNLIHFLHYAVAVYGWPIFMMMNRSTGCCQLCPQLTCCGHKTCFRHCCRCNKNLSDFDSLLVYDDNCCGCNFAALENICETHNYQMVHITYHVGIGEPPFFVALDHDKKCVVISVRGTLSLQDLITDLNAEGEPLPTNPIHEDWLGHKGMVQAANYIKQKLLDDAILDKAFNYCPEMNSQSYDLVLVGHSLGAGTAAILSILLKENFPNLQCYAFSPPGGLLSSSALEYTKEFVVSVVLGKDVVPRLGLHQLEKLRYDLIEAIKRNNDPKWKIIGKGIFCCSNGIAEDDSSDERVLESTEGSTPNIPNELLTKHPNEETIALTAHQPLYPPGRIIHIVRNHPSKSDQIYESRWRQVVHKNEPVYQALWASNEDFNTILISPVMIQDHMPDRLLDALDRLLTNTGPAKPQRLAQISTPSSVQHSSGIQRPLLHSRTVTPDSLDFDADRTPTHIVLETSFIDLQPLDDGGFLTHARKRIRPNYLPHLRPFRKVDLIHDDWFGNAPLASPETLSDISSITSSILKPISSSSKLNSSPKFSTLRKASSSNDTESSGSTPPELPPKMNRKLHFNIQPSGQYDYIHRNNNYLEEEQNVNNNDFTNYYEIPCKEIKRVTFDLSRVDEITSLNSGNESSEESELLPKKANSSNEGSPSVHQCSSDTDLSRSTWDFKPLPLRRTHELKGLNNLDDSACVFDAVEQQDSCNGTQEGHLSPTSQMLFRKLMAIESPSSDSSMQPASDECFQISFARPFTESNL